MQDTRHIIQEAQQGSEQAGNDLFRLIIEEHMPARINRRKGRNVLVGDHEIESDFLFGAFRALDRVDLDRGDPLQYLLWKGDMAVAQLFRSRVQQGVVASCSACGGVKRVSMKRGRSTCRTCGSEQVSTQMFQDAMPEFGLQPDLSSDELAAQADAVFFAATYTIQVQEMRSLLRGRVLELFDIIVLEDINQKSSQNYLKEIATRWGVSTAAVAIYLRKLRRIIGGYLAR